MNSQQPSPIYSGFASKEVCWEQKKMSDVFSRITKRNTSSNSNILTISALHGLVNQQEVYNKNIAANDTSNYYLLKKGDFAFNKSRSQEYPFGTIKRLKQYENGVVSPLYICFRLKSKDNPTFFEYYFETKEFNDKLGKIAQEGARNHGLLNFSIEEFFNIPLSIPPIEIQDAIAATLSSLDDSIHFLEKAICSLEKHKKALLHSLFPLKGKFIPEICFDRLQGKKLWEIFKIGDCFIERTIRGNNELPLLSVTDEHGLILQFESGKRLNSIVDKSKYLKVCKGDIVYNTMRMWQGRCAYADIDGVVSPAYTVCKPKKGMDSLFFFYYFKTPKMIQEFRKYSQGLVDDTLNLKYKIFSQIQIVIPTNISEQKKIAKVLSNCDLLIKKETKKLEMLRLHKQGLIQQLFPHK